MTTSELAPLIGRRVSAKFESLWVECTILECKQAYGRVRLLISPLEGSGEQWVDETRILAEHLVRPSLPR
jgi:hypothetical protein